MLCELAVGLSCVLLLPVLAVAAFFLLKSRMRPRDDVAGALHRPQWERDVVYLVQFPTAPHCRTISPFALKLETWLRASKVKYEPVYSLKFSTATGQIPYVELNGEEMAGTYYCTSRTKKPGSMRASENGVSTFCGRHLHLRIKSILLIGFAKL